MIRPLSIACMVAAISSAHAAAPTAQPLRRFALVVGSNDGGGDRIKLHYAGHDATSVADVLQELGGVTSADLELLHDPDAAQLDAAFDALSARVRGGHAVGQRVELVVYYSGHADETGILIGGAHYDYARLRQRISAVAADVRIAIVDSCASGSFTRLKGGSKTAPFLQDRANQVEGFAFLASSSATEDAQESDKIGASFFTYFFVAGLRGAADRNHDGKITLTEAYEFAYEQTLGRTQRTLHGPQHPSYAMQLSGSGDVVMTDLRDSAATLILPAGLHGHVTVVDTAGRIAIELVKDAGAPLALALPDGVYEVYVDFPHKVYVTTVTLDRTKPVELDPSALAPATREPTIARGVARAHSGDDSGDDDDDDDDDDGHHRDHAPWYRDVEGGTSGGLRVERPSNTSNFGALVTFGGESRSVSGSPVVGGAESMELSLGLTLGNRTEFAYDLSFGFGPGVFIGRHLQLGATVGFGFSGITGGILDFAWKVPLEVFAILELSPEVKPMAYFRESYLFSSAARQNGSTLAIWGADEAEVGAGLKFGGKLNGFIYASMRQMENVDYWGIGIGAMF